MSDRIIRPRQRIVKLRGRPTSSKKSAHEGTPSRPSTPSHTDDTTTRHVPAKESEAYLQQLIRRQFYPSLQCTNFQDVLPALTSSTKVDIQLYALIGLLFRSFIHKWYKNLTDDTEFTTELVGVVAHITRTLETRLRGVNVLELLLDDIPLVLDEHMRCYRRVLRELGSSFLPFDTIDAGFDYLSNHRAFQGGEEEKEAYLKVLAANVLERLLPADEARSELVRKFVGALMGDMLLKIVTNKISQPYQIFEIITLVCNVLVAEGKDEKSSAPVDEKKTNFVTSIVSSISHFIADTTSLNHKPEGIKQMKPVSALHILPFLNNVFQINTHRPVLYAMMMSTVPIMKQERVNHILHNLLQNKLVNAVRSDTLFAWVIKAGRNNLFPTDEDMGPPRIEPDQEEFEQIRQKTKDSLLKLCRKFQVVSYLLVATKEEGLDDAVDDFLTSFEHTRINEHLVFKLVDLVVLRLFPDLAEGRD